MLFLGGLKQNSQTMFYRLLIGATEKKDFVVFKNHKINLKSGDTQILINKQFVQFCFYLVFLNKFLGLQCPSIHYELIKEAFPK